MLLSVLNPGDFSVVFLGLLQVRLQIMFNCMHLLRGIVELGNQEMEGNLRITTVEICIWNRAIVYRIHQVKAHRSLFIENSIDNPEYSLKRELPALYLNLSDSNIFEILLLSIMHVGSSVGITQGDTIRINPRSFMEATGKQPLSLCLGISVDVRMQTLGPSQPRKVRQFLDVQVTLFESCIRLCLMPV